MPPGRVSFTKEMAATPILLSWSFWPIAFMVRLIEWTGRWAQSIFFPLVILIATGLKFALAPLFLGFLYARLHECVANITRSVTGYTVVTHKGFWLFTDVSMRKVLVIHPQTVEFLAIVTEEVISTEGSKKVKSPACISLRHGGR